jgi:hypothetical protein
MQVWDSELMTVRRLGPRLVMLFVEAFAVLALARLAVWLVPFRRLVALLGAPLAPLAAGEPLPPAQRETAREIAWALRAAVRRLPLDAACLAQAIAGRFLLRKRGIAPTVHLGLAQGLEGVALGDISLTVAHAWLEAGGIRVSGYPLDPALIEVAAFR